MKAYKTYFFFSLFLVFLSLCALPENDPEQETSCGAASSVASCSGLSKEEKNKIDEERCTAFINYIKQICSDKFVKEGKERREHIMRNKMATSNLIFNEGVRNFNMMLMPSQVDALCNLVHLEYEILHDMILHQK